MRQNGALHKVQQAWIEHDVPQCGYCQSGMIMAVAALLKEKPKPTDADIDDAITNICRCGTFQQVREAIHAAAKRVREDAMNHMPTNQPPLLRRRHRRRRRRACARLRSSLRRPNVVRAADGAPEVNAWVVIRPDDTVVIRIARSEMGQGTLTGLAQLVAEELECDWSKVTTEYPTPGQNVARKRAWGDFSTGGSRGIRKSQEYVRKGGAAARMMLIQAAAERMEGAGFRVHRGQQRDHAHAFRPHHHLRQGGGSRRQARAAEGRQAQGSEGLEDRRQARSSGSTPPTRSPARLIYGIDVKLPGMLNAAIKDCPVFGGKLKSFDAAKVTGMKGVKKVVQVGDNAVAVVADTWWQAKTALDALPIVWDEGENAKVSSASIAEWLKEGLDAEQAFVGNQNGDAKAAFAGAAKKVEAVYAYPYQNHATMEPMNATALYTRRQMRGLVPHAERRSRVRGDAARPPACRPTNATCTRSCLAAASAGAARTDYVRQAVLIAKQMPGTPVKLLWSREEDMTHGTYHPVTQCKLTGGFDADNNLTALHMRHLGTVDSCQQCVRQALQNGMDPATFQGLNPGGPEGRDRLHDPQSADRPFDAQPACSAGLLARREHQPERHLSRMLHGRAGACGRAGPARVPAQADGEASQAPRRAQCGRGEDRLGQAGAARRLSRASRSSWASAATWRPPPKSP